jgi:stage II sporulation protein D
VFFLFLLGKVRFLRLPVPFFAPFAIQLFYLSPLAGEPTVRVGVPLLLPLRCEGGVLLEGGGTASRTIRRSQPLRCGGVILPREFELLPYQGRWYARLTFPLEEYLEGVLPVEMNPTWPLEALKAQAVVSRTYALRLHLASKGPFDLLAGEAHQVFRYDPDPPSSIQKAVRATRGEILFSRKGEVAEVAFHSCCGGRTAKAGEIWKRDSPDLISIRDPFCTLCPNFYWSVVLSPEELGRSLGLGPVQEIQLLRKGESGRILDLRISDGRRSRSLSGSEFREILGTDRIRSTLFTLSWEGEGEARSLRIQGSGSGHGVGLCQWGAKGMAEEGKGYREILKFYFPLDRLGRIR